mmetsp:Transcript_52166/g.93557  ORF Transcript_52166/g.93557 Transcript_52166/m.93557 type:complete len:203 (-) Transcript_52166:1918-2526(-)
MNVPDARLGDEHALVHSLLALVKDGLRATSNFQFCVIHVTVAPCKLGNHMEDVHGIAIHASQLHGSKFALQVGLPRRVAIAKPSHDQWHARVFASTIENVAVVTEGIHTKIPAKEAAKEHAGLLAHVEDSHVSDHHGMHQLPEFDEVNPECVENKVRDCSTSCFNHLGTAHQRVTAECEFLAWQKDVQPDQHYHKHAQQIQH